MFLHFSFIDRVKCPVPIHDASSHPLFTKKSSCVRSRSVRNLYDGLKLVEKSTPTLLKKTRQINDTNKKLEPVESRTLFLCQKIFNKL